MDAKQAAVLSRLLDSMLSLLPEQRDAWLAQLGAEHAALKPRLRALLARTPSLGTLPKLEASEVTNFRCTHEVGATVGPYRLLRRLGAGAMGVVWLATRTDGLAPTQVALKFAHVAPRRSDLRARLEREHQLMLAMDHPNIARLFDAGTTDEDQPYLVLEYVPGRSLSEYVELDQPSQEARLALFLQLARAVAHAHGCQIVHRDLKPSNVLVTRERTVRLLDFGIAKLLAHGVPADAQLSRLTGQPLTPAYASPEQLLGATVEYASDVYSLGVVLFELLTGRRPYASRGAVAERASILEGAPCTVGNRRLDAIVNTALQREPARRFPSARELVAALEDYGASASLSNSRAFSQSRRTVRSVTPSTSAISRSVMPPK